MTQRQLIFRVIIVAVGLSGAVWLLGDPWRARSAIWGPSPAGACGGMMGGIGPGGL